MTQHGKNVTPVTPTLVEFIGYQAILLDNSLFLVQYLN